MTRKILNKSAPGTSTKFGADDLDYINKLLTGEDQTSTDPVDINTNFKIRHGKLLIANSGNTFNHIINGSATGADKTLTLPNLTGTAVTEDGAQTLTNKTMDYNSNTFQNFPAGGITASSTDTLTNKTMAFGSNTFTGFVTPSSTDTFTNKTMSGSNNTFTNLPAPVMPPESKKIGGYYGGIYTAGATLVAGTLEGSLSGYTAATTTGAATYFSDANGRYTRQTSGAVSGNDAGFNINTDATTNPIMQVRGDQNPRFKCKFRFGNAALSSNAVVRCWIGFVQSATTGLLTGDGFGTGVANVALILNSAGTNYLFSHNDASGPNVTTDTAIARNTSVNTIELKTTDSGTTWAWNLNGTTGTETTNIPAATATLIPVIQIETAEAVAKILDTWYWLLETSA